jgi:FKBP-type peptidyl-prolyl cis-trans isomerase SlyD
MDNKQSKYISVSYTLYSIEDNGEKQLVEQTEQGQPFNFITGFGFSLDTFEQRMIELQQGEKFDFTLTPAEAFGDYDEEGVHKMEREKFYVDGRFDSEHIYVDSVIMLNDNEGKRFLARVIAMDNETVTLDTNHPLAGKTLQFTGEVLTNRDATKEEIQSILNQLSHECGGCGGHCGGCGGDDCGEDHECGGGCGHCH